MPERIAGRYRVLGLLGKGGFGAVYEAFDELERRPVAVKLIRRDITTDPRFTQAYDSSQHVVSDLSRVIRRHATRSFGPPSSHSGDNVAQAFKDEFRLLTQLHHPNLAGVYDFGRCHDSDSFYFTQELVDGVELTDFLREATREMVVEVLVQLARALDYIHALGLVHGDIKPSNVLVVRNIEAGGTPQAKLIDFGLARMLRQPDPELEGGGTLVLGTPGFSAPEKVKGLPTDARSDIYSLAATVYAAARGGHKPFAGKDFKEVLRAQRDWRPELAGALLQQTGPVVAELVGRMLLPDPNMRPQSARSVVLELLRREATHRDRQQTARDRHEFARVLVEHLPFVDRAHYLELLLDKAAEIIGRGRNGDDKAAKDPATVAGVEPLADTTIPDGPVITGEDPAANSGVLTKARLIRTVIIKAPEGMGKSRLMSELRREVQLGDGLFVQGSCWGSDSSALGPFANVVTQLATALGERSPTVQRFGNLVRAAHSAGAPGADIASHHLSEFLLSAAEERSYVLHISDLSRAQEPMRVAFEQLCRAIDHNDAPILLCATTEPHSKISPILMALGRDQVAEVWSLRPFTNREMYQVLLGILGDTPTLKELAIMLDKLTGGHPLSFRETLRVLIEEGILVREADTWVLRGASAAAEELHKTLAQRSESRLDGLGASGWEIASILYLVEAPLPESQLASLSDLRAERFKRTLDRLEGEGLVTRSASSGESIVQLAHESVREAIRGRYADSLDETRIDLADRIEELQTSDPHYVFLRARLLDDASESLEAADELEKSADALFEADQPQLAAQVLERLIRRLRRFGRAPALPRLLEAQLKLLEKAAGALEDPRRELGHYEAGILVAELVGDFRAEALFWLGLVDRYTNAALSDIELSLERLEHAAEAARLAHDRALELRIDNRRAEVLLGAGEIEKASEWSRQAMAILEVDEASVVDKCHIMGVRLRCLTLSGKLGEARRLHEIAQPIAAQVPVVQRQSYLSGIAYLAVLGGEPQRAIPETEQALEELRAAKLPRLLLTPLHNLGDLRLRNDDLPKAEDDFREAIRLAAVYGFDYHVHLNRGFMGYVRARRGEVEEGAAMLGEAKEGMMQIQGEHLAVQQLRLLDAEVAHMLGQSARARRELEEMLADFHAANELSLAHWAQEALARIEQDLGTAFIENPGESDPDTDPEQDTVRTKPVK
ncbi:serine/threonine-protein kinase [Paraliomyxa miuraensis]|uniref:serine/threonine-protein kinase n=1 Tax=Paraliomyxa miuraensis TaxID=376150 RepID=UPI002253FC99|nr:serine/threonine-protein kinase [Paraliomyxa miuraensis]MCX4247944.1 protein kinase [Paraliomyxa miuraensis]